MTNDLLKIGIVIGSTREGRISPQVGAWVKEQADLRGDAIYQIIDVKDFHLPLLGESDNDTSIKHWQNTLNDFDGFVFIVAEYNHSITASLKNALDLARDPWINKAAGIVSHGSVGGARAAEHLRGILGELQIADVRTHVALSMFTDFVDRTTFNPQKLHLTNLNAMLDQVNAWSRALKPLRA